MVVMVVMVVVIRKINFTLFRLPREPGHDRVGSLGFVPVSVFRNVVRGGWLGIVISIVLSNPFEEFVDGDIVGRHVGFENSGL